MIDSISYVIPCYRSENTLTAVVEELLEKTRQLGISNYEIILVNDCSPDNVWSIIKRICAQDKKIKGVSLSRNFGQHAALLAGYSCVQYDTIVSLDDDGQTPIDELEKLLNKLDEGYDAVYAYYEEIKQNSFRRFGSWMAKKMGEWMIGFPKDLKGSSFYAVRKYVIDEMIKYKNPYPYLGGLVFQTTHSITCVLTHHRNRSQGTSGYSIARLFKLWMNGFTAFSVKPIRFGTFAGLFLSFAGIITALVLIIRKAIHPEIAVGWTSIISAVLIVGGLILGMIGLVGEYVGRIYISINHNPQYVIKETIN